ncbi:MAG: hypothetical protein P4M01_05470 [Acidobacteriota bacterium]|nr:hypothetical protein [Acidobacteriota bacterium]
MWAVWDQGLFTLLACIAAGLLALSLISGLTPVLLPIRRLAALAASIALAAAGVFSALYLGHPERIFGTFANPESPITEGLIAWFIGFCACLFQLRRMNERANQRRLAPLLGLLVPVGMMIVLGRYHSIPYRSGTAVALFATLFSSAAVAMAACFALVFYLFRKGAKRPRLGALATMAVAGAIFVVTLVHLARGGMMPAGFGPAPEEIGTQPGGAGAPGGAQPANNGSNNGDSGPAYGDTPDFLKQDDQ